MQGIHAMQITGKRKDFYSMSDTKNEIFMWGKIEMDHTQNNSIWIQPGLQSERTNEHFQKNL